MEEIFRKLIASDLSDVAGLTVDASIPVPQSLINELIEAALQEDKTIRSCQVSIHEQNRVSIRLKTNILPWPVNLRLKLDAAVDFASFSSPKVRMWLENNHLLSSLGSFFNALPRWAKLYDDQIVIDLGFFLRTPQEKKLFALLKSIGIRTEERGVVFDVKLEVG